MKTIKAVADWNKPKTEKELALSLYKDWYTSYKENPYRQVSDEEAKHKASEQVQLSLLGRLDSIIGLMAGLLDMRSDQQPYLSEDEQLNAEERLEFLETTRNEMIKLVRQAHSLIDATKEVIVEEYPETRSISFDPRRRYTLR